MAKEEIQGLHFALEKKFQKETIRLGLENQKPIFGANVELSDTQLRARLEVFEQEMTGTLRTLLKAYSSLQTENVKIQRRLTEVVVQQNFDMQLNLVQSQL